MVNWEKLGVAAVLFFMVFVAVPSVELFPFSTAPMFAAVYREFWIYRLTDGEGQMLNLDRYGLRSNANWYLESHYAVQHPPNVVSPPSNLPATRFLFEHIRNTAVQQGDPFPLVLEARAIGDIGNGRVGITRSHSWVVTHAD